MNEKEQIYQSPNKCNKYWIKPGLFVFTKDEESGWDATDDTNPILKGLLKWVFTWQTPRFIHCEPPKIRKNKKTKNQIKA